MFWQNIFFGKRYPKLVYKCWDIHEKILRTDGICPLTQKHQYLTYVRLPPCRRVEIWKSWMLEPGHLEIWSLKDPTIRRALAQGVSDDQPLDSNNEQQPFVAGLTVLDNFESKNQHRAEKKTTSSRKNQHWATAAATVAVVVAVVAQIVSCSGRARGLSGSLRIRR